MGLVAFAILGTACGSQASQKEPHRIPNETWYRIVRGNMVEQVEALGVRDERVLAALRAVRRHLFVPDEIRHRAYSDNALPIGEGQTISQPFVVGLMSELLELRGDEKVLEIGTGSGYQAALLARLVDSVYTIEIIETLAQQAGERLRELGYTNATVRHGDGYWGWPEEAPFDAIILTAAPGRVPAPLVEQLKAGGRMAIPVWDELTRITREEDGIERQKVIRVRFVPMTGEVQSR
jgi:protein-L-isoaspartate(D-aspartate) O-methyltransferase